MTTFPPEPLFAPLRVGDKLIGFIILDERVEHSPYAGPDVEALHLLLARFTPLLEAARLNQVAAQRMRIVQTLYSANPLAESDLFTVEALVQSYAETIARAFDVHAECWCPDDSRSVLRRISVCEQTSSLSDQDVIPLWADAGRTIYCSGERTSMPPASISPLPGCAWAWLPVLRGNCMEAVIVVIYPRPHRFSEDEKSVLALFVSQCVGALENIYLTRTLERASSSPLHTLVAQAGRELRDIEQSLHALRFPLRPFTVSCI